MTLQELTFTDCLLHSPQTRGRTTALLGVGLLCLLLHTSAAHEVLSCANGLDGVGSRQRFWNFEPSAGIPVLTDLVSTHGQVNAIFNIKGVMCHYCWKTDWAALKWTCEFEGGVEDAIPPASDPHGHTLIVTCRMRLSANTTNSLNLPVRVSITAQNMTSNATTKYDGLTFCRYPDDRTNGSFKYHLGGCTSVAGAHLSRVPEWITYHLQQGWEHFYIYVNEDPAAALTLLGPFIKAGVVDVIDFQWPPSADFSQQQAAENSCIRRYRGLSRWVSMTDVDEFFQPMRPVTVAVYLHGLASSTIERLGAARVSSYRFSSGEDNGTALSTAASGPSYCLTPVLCLSEFVFREATIDRKHVKALVQPEHLTYFSVHVITLGRPSIELDPFESVRVAHYKTPRYSRHAVLDTSMCQSASSVRKGMVQFGLGNHSVPEAAWSASWVAV